MRLGLRSEILIHLGVLLAAALQGLLQLTEQGIGLAPAEVDHFVALKLSCRAGETRPTFTYDLSFDHAGKTRLAA